MSGLLQNRRCRRSGAAAVEMAVLSPFLLLVLFAIIEFGWYFMVRMMVHSAAAEGARWSIVLGHEVGQGNDGALQDELQQLVEDRLDPLNVSTVTVVRVGATSPAAPNEVITVTIPLHEVALPGFVLKFLFSDFSSVTIERTVTMAHPNWA